MEMQAPWIVCRMGRKLHLLAKDEKAYYVIEVGKNLDYATEEWLESQGVSEELLKELQLPFEYIPRKALTSLGYSGYGPGDVLQLNLKNGKRILTLAEEVDKDFYRDFFPGLLRTKVPREISEKQNPRWRQEKRDKILYKKLSWVPAALIAASLLVNFGYARTKNPIWFSLCLLVLLAPVALDILMPGYFTIFFTEKSKKPDAWSLEAPLMISLIAMAVTRRFDILESNAMLWMIGIAALASGLLCLLAEEFRRKPAALLAAAFMGGLFGSLAVAQANVVYAPEEPRAYILEVEETHKSGGKNTTYYCTVILPDGREEKLHISRSLYENLEAGDFVRVELGVGLFGFEFANVYPYEEGA
jgi:hypothetical protein